MVDAFLKADNINRVRYAVPAVTVSTVNVGYTAAPAKDYQVFTSTDGMRNTTMDKITAYAAGLLFICQESQAVTTVSITGCGARTELTRASPAVVFSVGSNAEVALGNLSSGGEASNQTPNSVAFFQGSRVDKRGAATPYYFDDLVTWISPNTLFLRMGQAGKLP